MTVLKIGVVGSGVIGLTTALELQHQLPGASVTILADKFNEDTTSDGAAGIFRIGTSFASPSEEITRYIVKESYQYYNDLLEKYNSKETGVSQVSGYIFSSTNQSLVENHLIDKIVPVYRPARKEELKLCPGDWKYGSYFTTILTECRRFLPWAMNRFVSNNGTVVNKKITSLSQFENENFEVIVNCTGLGAKELCKDHKIVPIRGQVLKISAPWLKNFFYADYDTYIIPGQDNVTLGGCRHYDSYSLDVSRHDTAAIWERCTALVPRLGDCKIDREWVGLRPHRDPVRLEAELIRTSNKPFKVVHNYGHGGYGVSTAPGSARYAVKLVKDILKMSTHL